MCMPGGREGLAASTFPFLKAPRLSLGISHWEPSTHTLGPKTSATHTSLHQGRARDPRSEHVSHWSLQERADPFHLGQRELGRARPAKWNLHVASRSGSVSIASLSPEGLCQCQLLREHFLGAPVVIWLWRWNWLVYLCLRFQVCLPPYISLAGLFGYSYKHSPSALIVILPEPFYMSVMSCFGAMKTRKNPIIPCNNLKTAEISWRAWGWQGQRELLCGQDTMLTTSKMSLSSTDSIRYLTACEKGNSLVCRSNPKVSRLPAGLQIKQESFYLSSILYFPI